MFSTPPISIAFSTEVAVPVTEASAIATWLVDWTCPTSIEGPAAAPRAPSTERVGGPRCTMAAEGLEAAPTWRSLSVAVTLAPEASACAVALNTFGANGTPAGGVPPKVELWPWPGDGGYCASAWSGSFGMGGACGANSEMRLPKLPRMSPGQYGVPCAVITGPLVTPVRANGTSASIRLSPGR